MSSKHLSDDILEKFRKEAIDHVRESQRLLQSLGPNGRDPAVLAQIGRHLHAVKGSAPIMGAHPLSTIARELEGCLKVMNSLHDSDQALLLDKFSDALETMDRQIGQFSDRQEIESGNDVLEALRSLMPASALLEGILNRLAADVPELFKALEETQRGKLKDAVNERHRVYSVYISLSQSAFQPKLVEALKMIATTGAALAYAHSSKPPREGFDQVMAVLVLSELPPPEFSRRLEMLPADIVEIVGPGVTAKPSEVGEARSPVVDSQAHVRVQKRRILLVEDSNATRELYRMVLVANGFEVETAQDGEEALDRLKNAEFNAVVSDDQMPVMDGMELLRTMKSDADLQKLPVIIMSGKGTEEDRTKALATGAAEYFVKGTFEKSVLIAALKRVSE